MQLQDDECGGEHLVKILCCEVYSPEDIILAQLWITYQPQKFSPRNFISAHVIIHRIQ